MKMIKITCDSACDLPGALSSRYRILEIPLKVRLGNQTVQDKLEVSPEALYSFSQRTGNLPEISPVPVSDYRSLFLNCLREGYEVLHISLSSHMSDCFQNAREAAKDLKGVSVIDSESISAGAGQLALLAAELIHADYRLEDLTQAINEMKKHLDVSCLLNSSGYLHKKGRAGGLTAFSEGLLKLKPEISLKNGLIRRSRAFHGDLEEAIASYVKSRLDGRRNVQTDRVFITYSGLPEHIVSKTSALVAELQPFEQILEIPASSAVSCRCGPGSLGLAFMTT